MHTPLRAFALALLAPALAHAAPGDEGLVTEEVTVTAAPGKAPRPSLNLSLPKYDLPMQDLRFPSGLRVIFQKDSTQPIIAITSVTDHGSSEDPLGKEGIAHLVEHLWFRSEHGELPKTWDLLEAEMGCDLNAFTQYDITAYMTSCGSQFLEAMLKLESLRITDTVKGVTEEMVDTEVEVVRNEIRMRGENFNIPFFTMWEYVNKHMFPEGHPYHRPIAGDHTTIRNCKLADIQKFTEDYYRPENNTIAVVGDIPSSD
ncbi:MAG: insulinase family protein, partial [Myxococcales bacterium]|nr:insulinase family protein [Myxococcales bacterium]